ncbi:hypothetical protein [Heyndrickxia faecalis]|uniref:hypothetical protein n=1 Tax=Heyndrickxia faecalis TaxID=2824910 RepID=UPI003D240E2B
MRWPYANIGVVTTRTFRNLLNKIHGDIAADMQEHKDRADNIQAQINNLVADGDSSPEAAQARVGTDGTNYATLKARLDSENQIVTSQLTDISINIKQFSDKAVKDSTGSIIDWAPAIQAAIDFLYSQSINSNQGGTILIPAGTFYVIGKSQTIILRSNVSIRGIGKSSVIKIHESTGDWGYLFFGGQTELLENVTISDLVLDCNVNNPVTKTERWQYSNRVLINVGEAKDFKLANVMMITNGVWGFRGFVENGEISNNEFIFEPPIYQDASFDVSTIWIGGKHNRVLYNTLIANWRSDFIPETAIETQGHYSYYGNNTVRGYKVGLIESNNTGYENPLNPILELGALYNKIVNNTFEVLVGGLTLWAMHVADDSYIKGCQISNNNFKIVEGNNLLKRSRYGIGISKADLTTGSTHDGVQTGKINTLKIDNNHIEFEKRVVSDSISSADAGVRLDTEFEIEGTDISQNTFYNIGGFGVYLSAAVDSVLNPNSQFIKNTIIQNNIFLEVRKPIRVNTRVKRTTITNNSFVQQIDYPNLIDNMIVTIEAYSRSAQDTSRFFIKNNSISSSVLNHRPFYPKYLLGLAISNYSRDYQDILENNEPGVVVVQGQTDRYQIVQNGNFLIGKDGLRYGLTNTIQATIGRPYGINKSDVKVVKVVDSTILEFSDTLDIYPSQSLSLKCTDGTYKVVTVLSVYKQYVFFTVDVSQVKINEIVKYYSDNLGLVN